MFRLKQKHTTDKRKRLPPADGRRILAEQSLLRGFIGGFVAALLLCWAWAVFAMATNRVFPWFTILIGALIGLAIQRYGRGLDWRFPVMAVAITAFASYAGNLMIGVLETGRYIEADTVSVMRGLSFDTMRNFFRNTVGPVDHIYAFSACGVAAFFANRRLKRHEVLGLRTMDQRSELSNQPIVIYGDSRSGNCYKLKLLCAEMDIGYDWREVDILDGDTRTPEFLSLNPNGKIPLLVLPDGRTLAESNAILCYLADGSQFLGGDAFARATILQWMFFEQYSHEPYIATSRFIIQYLGTPPERAAELDQKKAGGYHALGVMEQALDNSEWLTGDQFTIADIALFAYTHVADEGDFSLADYPNIRSWIERLKLRPNFVAM